MFDHPYPVVGGASPATPGTPTMFDRLLRQPAPLPAPTIGGSRRRKLWEINHKFHCPIIGVCFGVDELRGLMAKVMHFPRDTTDFVLHTSAVAACEERGPLAELLQKTLEKRYQAGIRRLAAAKTVDALRRAWQEAAHHGSGLPAMLWAAWTHPACEAGLAQDIYADIHMIQHQVGTGTRADLATLHKLRDENGELRRQLEAARRDNETLRSEKSREGRSLGQQIAELQAELAGKDAWGANLSSQLEQLRQSLPELKERQLLARRASDAEARTCALSAHASSLEQELAHLHRLLQRAEDRLQQLSADRENSPPTVVDRSTAADLAGKSVLCVGGRSGAVDAYRQMIERRGGRFLHHDGGLEESLHRIDGALHAADLVICQAGCISHNAYWRVKEQCKRSGKPCLYLKSGGVSGLSRLIDGEQPALAADGPG